MKIQRLKNNELKELRFLRQEVLHPGGAEERVIYEYDERPDAVHIVILEDGEWVSCGTLLPQDESGDLSEDVYRVRGMAVKKSHQKKGLGKIILKELLSSLDSKKPSKVWCNARTTVLDFYKSFGFEVKGEEFLLPPNIPHYKLVKSYNINTL